MPRPKLLVTTLACSAAIFIGACGGDEETPAACFGDAGVYLTALEAAPRDVRLEGEVPISECLTDDQEGGEIGQVGEPMIAAATRLNAAARRDPDGDATLQLGYLVGAVQEGASTTGGIHRDLVLRLDAAARFQPQGKVTPPAFERTFGTGYAAGQDAG